jgi:hypothetical protein
MPLFIEWSIIIFIIGILDFLWKSLQFRSITNPCTALASIALFLYVASTRTSIARSAWMEKSRQISQFTFGYTSIGFSLSPMALADRTRTLDPQLDVVDHEALLLLYRATFDDITQSIPIIESCMDDLSPSCRVSLVVAFIAEIYRGSRPIPEKHVLKCASATSESRRYLCDLDFEIIQSDRPTLNRLLTCLLNTLDAVQDPVQRVKITVFPGLTVARKVNMLDLLHILLKGWAHHNQGNDREIWDRSYACLLSFDVHKNPVAALDILLNLEEFTDDRFPMVASKYLSLLIDNDLGTDCSRLDIDRLVQHSQRTTLPAQNGFHPLHA